MVDSTAPLKKLLDNYTVRKFRKGQTLLFQGEVPRYAFVIKSGTVKTYNLTALGEEQIIALSTEYDIVPEAWLLGEASVAYYFYEAYTDCEIYTIPRDDLTRAVEENSALASFVLLRFMRLYVGSNVHINALEQSKSRDKIIHLLHYLMLRFGTNLQNGTVKINLRLTHQVLANMVGLTRETIATELSRLRKQKIISYEGQSYTVNRQKLLQLRNEDDLISGL